jgi:hypothetical protein
MPAPMSESSRPLLDACELRQLSQGQTAPCTCALKHCQGWESVSDDRWPAAQMPVAGTLRQPLADGQTEPTFEEFHPEGTRYESPDAPIALQHFPYNRCDVHTCLRCGGAALRYTEYGGYYVDHRARRVDPVLIVD